MRVLFSTASAAGYMLPPTLGDEQINCGPDWKDERDPAGRVRSLATPVGEYDLAALAATLPGEQQPDIVACLVDASWRNVPRNLGAFRCPTVLLVADTHHLDSPLISMLRYVASEAYHRVVFLYDRHHAAFFHAAGLQNLYWFPGLTFPHDDATVRKARRSGARAPVIAFVGQAGRFHPRRQRMIESLVAGKVPVRVQQVPQVEGLRQYGASLLGLNVSLNGDLNLRVFEVLAAGGALLTDRLAPGSGLDQLLGEGREAITYGSAAELVERAKAALARPRDTAAIGAAGAAWFDAHLGEARRRAAFQALAMDGTPVPEFEFAPAEKAQVFFGGDTDRLLDTLLVYEHVQELHRQQEQVRVDVDGSAPDVREIFATLPRIAIGPGACELDLRVMSRGSDTIPNCGRIWCWDAQNGDRDALAQRLRPDGYEPLHDQVALFARRPTPVPESAEAALARGAHTEALALAQQALAHNAADVGALGVIGQMAQKTGNAELAKQVGMLLAHLDPRNPLIRSRPGAGRSQAWLDAMRRQISRDPAGAVAGCRAAVQESPNDPNAWRAAAELNLALHAVGPAAEAYRSVTQLSTDDPGAWRDLGRVMFRIGRMEEAMAALMRATALAPNDRALQMQLGAVALAVRHSGVARSAFTQAQALSPGDAGIAQGLAESDKLDSAVETDADGCDLIICHLEICRLHGSGVLLQRFFPKGGRSQITLRGASLYGGKMEFDATHLYIEGNGLSLPEREHRLRQLLAPYRIRRILCVPYYPADFLHGVLAKKITNAPLCAYVMDDQAVFGGTVPKEFAHWLFSSAELNLVISPEMAEAYRKEFRSTFAVLPPVLTSSADRVPNRWSGDTKRCAMVGNVWSARQFEQLRQFVRAAKIEVDWYGNAKVTWLPQDREQIAADGIHCRGFVPEPELAARLAEYAFVLVPSGELDGSEPNEWLTRLSLPSRMVFILGQTFTPMLVLGSPSTAAAGYVRRLGIGLSSSYAPAEAASAIAKMLDPQIRARMVARARQIADAFVLPDAGEWIWRSLAAGAPQPLALTPLLSDGQPAVTLRPPAGAVHEFVERLLGRLADPVACDRFLAPGEPRVKHDIRGAVRLLQEALRSAGSVANRLLLLQRLAERAPHHRAILVTGAELLEQLGNHAGAAAAAREALAVFYDDVYTQNLFVRCTGEENPFVTHGAALYCRRPFENFEIYDDGSVFLCNCTWMPLPIGNVFKQTPAEIWQSPAAQAARASILDGSFRYCSPMTCPFRLALPARDANPAEFDRLREVGVNGYPAPLEINLSYDRSCNLSCPSCRTGPFMADGAHRLRLDELRDSVVLPLLRNARGVYVSGSGDPLASPHTRSVLQRLCAPEFKDLQITLVTNGQLVTPEVWAQFEALHPRLRDVQVSVDGACKATYERLRRGASWERVEQAMEHLSRARRSGVITRLTVNMVVQETNFREMRPLLERCAAWHVDGVQFFRLRQWGHLQPEAFCAADVVNPLHPAHGELLRELSHPKFASDIVRTYDMDGVIRQAQRRDHASSLAPVRVSTGVEPLVSPEEDLLVYLSTLLPSRRVADIGANVGDFSAALLEAGLEVHAFEPNPAVLATLCERFAGEARFQAHNEALGASDTTARLFVPSDRSVDRHWGDTTRFASLHRHAMPAEMVFDRSVEVPVARLDTLHRTGALPTDLDIVKIDTEGHDMDVIRGMGENRYPVVMTEFWDEDIVFAQGDAGSRLDEVVIQMRERGYSRHIVIYRIWGHGEAFYGCDLDRSPKRSWGNALFFQSDTVFEKARSWCTWTLRGSAVKPTTARPESAVAEPIRDPEPALIAALASSLPSHAVLDVGANVGDFSAVLLKAGLAVHAFEPNPELVPGLRERFGQNRRFHLHECALGRGDGRAQLHLASDRSETGQWGDTSRFATLQPHGVPEALRFDREVSVEVRSLASLRAQGELPDKVSVLKIDTEGHDLEVIRGMGDLQFPIVLAEFWDEQVVFAKDCGYRFQDLVREMRLRGYHWHLVLYRKWGEDLPRYYCQLCRVPEHSWGNVAFFASEALLQRARDWCAARIPLASFIADDSKHATKPSTTGTQGEPAARPCPRDTERAKAHA